MIFAVASYKKGADRPDTVTDVSHIGAPFIADVLGMDVDRLTDVYVIAEDHVRQLSPHVDMAFDLATHDYHLEVLTD